MFDENKKYSTKGYNLYGIKYMQDNKLYNNKLEEVDEVGKPIIKEIKEDPPKPKQKRKPRKKVTK